jgi:2-polyprenyl-3-methyl-5-hydroxy-6-metoxy-1,4-benzoquinol methylase
MRIGASYASIPRMKTDTSILKAEAQFHDEWADSMNLADVDVRRAFEASTAPENRFILEKMGDIRGKRILDVGCGLGESSVYFALQGAKVTALDLSPKMVDLAKRLAQFHGTSIEGVVSSAEALDVPSCSFDFVYLGNVVHHVMDRDTLWARVKDVLKPGGVFFSWDPIEYNPVINVYRSMATEVRTVDEAPLRVGDLAKVKNQFGNVGHREFWFFTMVIFLKYFLVYRVSPNEDRYWKRILKEREENLGWFRVLQKIDSLIASIPGLRWLCWNTVVWGRKSA